ncbi:hypothetical protein MKW92_050932 [Papaver armeniacum]|nr:hypothetical protein MKW92_050932 [Papaver armeniacum]
MARVAIWYNGKIVDDNPHNPKYVGGKFKMFDVGENISVSEFFEIVREKCGIGSSIRITINYRLFLSSTSAALVDIAGCDTLSDFLSGSEIHAFYVQKECAPAEEPNPREIIERTSAGSKEPYPRGTSCSVQGSCSAHVVRDQPNLNLLKTRSSTTVQTPDVADSSRSSPHHSFDNVIDGSSDSSSLDDEQHNELLLTSSWDGGQHEMESPTDNPTRRNTQASGRHRSVSKADVGGSRFTSADLNAPILTSSALDNEFLWFALHDIAVRSRRELRAFKSDQQRVEWKCGAKGCGWCIREIKLVICHHLELLGKEMLKIQPDLSTKEIVTNIEKRFGIKISSTKSKRAMTSAKNLFMEITRTPLIILEVFRKELTIITNMKDSIVTSIKQFLPLAHHSFCLQRLTENFVSKCHEKILEDLVWRCGTAFTRKECDYFLEHLRRGNTQASYCYFSGCRYDIYTTKLTESFKAIIGDVLDLPITGLVLGTRTKVADYLCKRQQDVSDIANGLTKHYARLLEISQLESNIYNVTHFSLHESRVYIQDEEFSVNLDGRTCSCRQYQLMGMPCVHAIAAIQARHYKIYDYCAYWYTVETYRQTYSKTLSAIQSCIDWPCEPTDSPILPPTWQKRVVRPKRKNIESQSLVRGGTVRCGKCKEPGHNRRNCGVKSA